MYNDYKKPIWLNEFACPTYKNGTTIEQLKFMQIVLPRLKALPYLFRYAWFEARDKKGIIGRRKNMESFFLLSIFYLYRAPSSHLFY